MEESAEGANEVREQEAREPGVAAGDARGERERRVEARDVRTGVLKVRIGARWQVVEEGSAVRRGLE